MVSKSRTPRARVGIRRPIRPTQTDGPSGRQSAGSGSAHLLVQRLRTKPASLAGQDVLALQRLVGNAAAGHHLSRPVTGLPVDPAVVQRETIKAKDMKGLSGRVGRTWSSLEANDISDFLTWCQGAGDKGTEILDAMLGHYESHDGWWGEARGIGAAAIVKQGGIEDPKGAIAYLKASKAKPPEPAEGESDYGARYDTRVGDLTLPKALMDKLAPSVVAGYYDPTNVASTAFKQLLHWQARYEAAFNGSKAVAKWKDRATEATQKIDEVLGTVAEDAKDAKRRKTRDEAIDAAAAAALPLLNQSPHGTDALVQAVWQATIATGKSGNGYIELASGPYAPDVIGDSVHAWRAFNQRWRGSPAYALHSASLDDIHVPGGGAFIEDKGPKQNVQGVVRSYQADFILKWRGAKIVVHVNATGLMA